MERRVKVYSTGGKLLKWCIDVKVEELHLSIIHYITMNSLSSPSNISWLYRDRNNDRNEQMVLVVGGDEIQGRQETTKATQ